MNSNEWRCHKCNKIFIKTSVNIQRHLRSTHKIPQSETHQILKDLGLWVSQVGQKKDIFLSKTESAL